MCSTAAFDLNVIQEALSHFAAGVTISITRAVDGHAVAVTAKNFGIIATNPLLVHWTIPKKTRRLDAFLGAKQWVIQGVAGNGETPKCGATQGITSGGAGDSDAEDKEASSLLNLSSLTCATAAVREGTDSVVIVAEVTDFSHANVETLQISNLRPADPIHQSPETIVDIGTSGPCADHLWQLLSQASLQFQACEREVNDNLELNEVEHDVLLTLHAFGQCSAAELYERTPFADHTYTATAIDALLRRGLIYTYQNQTNVSLLLTEEGHSVTRYISSQFAALEIEVVARMGRESFVSLKSLLKRSLGHSGPAGRLAFSGTCISNSIH